MKYIYFVLILVMIRCQSNQDSNYLRWVGDSKFNPEIDNENFKPCHGDESISQYFNHSKGLQYEGHKPALVDIIKKKYRAVEVNESGWVRIRFVVNCNSRTGRFRITEADENYIERSFDQRITNQLINITKSLDGWKPLPSFDDPRDYYQYLLFKIENGDIIEIMP